MGLLKFNYKDIERPKPLPEGDYLFRATEVDDTGIAKSSGRPFTKISLVVAEGDHEGRKASYRMYHPMAEDKETTYDDDTTKWGLMHRMMEDAFRAFGLTVNKDEGFDTTRMIGQVTVGTIKHDVNEETGDIFASVDEIKAA